MVPLCAMVMGDGAKDMAKEVGAYDVDEICVVDALISESIRLILMCARQKTS